MVHNLSPLAICRHTRNIALICDPNSGAKWLSRTGLLSDFKLRVLPGNTIAKILSLGAAIIDQYDTDQVTTAIEYGPSPQPIAWGTEDRSPPVLMGLALPTPSPTPSPSPSGYTVLQRPFQNVGELGYAYNPITGNTLDFRTSGSSDAALLDFFTYNTTDNTATYSLPYPLRAGPVNINTRNSAVHRCDFDRCITKLATTGTGVPSSAATPAATLIAHATSAQPAMNRQDIARLSLGRYQCAIHRPTKKQEKQ